MKRIHFSSLVILMVFAALFSSCTDDDDISADPDGHHDEVHALIVMLTDEDGNVQEIEFDAEHDHDHDDDDDEGDDHDHEEHEIELSPNHTYTGELRFVNEEGENITSSIPTDEHLVCFDIESGLNLMIERTDMDVNGLEVGLESEWTTTGESEGHLTLEIRHQIDKSELDEENCSVGGTDVEAEFHVHIEE